MTWGVSTNKGRFSPAIRAFCAAWALAFAGLIPASAQAKNSPAVASGTADAVVLTPLTLLKVEDMVFGKIVAKPQAGTVILNPANSICTVTGSILHFGACQPAVMAGMVGNRTTFKIEVQGNTTLTGPGRAMLLDTMTLVPRTGLAIVGAGTPLSAASGNATLRVTTTTRIFTFGIGGTLHVNANQAPGVYVGTVSIQANYQ